MGLNSDLIDNAKKVTVSGILPLTTIDFPKHLASVFFTQGCSWRCQYCQNQALQPFTSDEPKVSFEKIEEFLKDRQGLIDGIVFSGGEPTEQKYLSALMQYVKKFGFKVVLHTNGSHSEILKKLTPLCDYIGMDMKAPFQLYDEITKIPNSAVEVKKSVEVVVASNIEYEFRTTFHPKLLKETDLIQAARELAELGAKNYTIQPFLKQGCPEFELVEIALPKNIISDATENEIRKIIPNFLIRK